MTSPFDAPRTLALIEMAKEEDLRTGDVTSEFTIPVDAQACGDVVARAAGVVAGLPLCGRVAHAYDGQIAVELRAVDGDLVSPDDVLARITGPARAVLATERVMLNFLQRLSGIATLTRRYVDAVKGTRAQILDTRKTTPGWRALEKYAVRAGGGVNHRIGLYDMVLIKDNHREMMAHEGIALADVVARIRRERPDIVIEVEADDESGVREALAAGVDIILLDNMPPERMRDAIALAAETPSTHGRTSVPACHDGGRSGRVFFEASGGINLETARVAAEAGVDRISVGALTHSAPALDIALDFRFV